MCDGVSRRPWCYGSVVASAGGPYVPFLGSAICVARAPRPQLIVVRRRAGFALLLGAGMSVRTAAARAPRRAAIGPRNDDRSIICSARRCTVDSDAVLLRARHGGRHEGGGRRQRKRDEELVHLGCAFASRDVLAQTALSDLQVIDPLRKPPRQPSGDLESNFRTPRVHLRHSEVQNLGQRRPRPRHAVLSESPPPQTPSPRELHNTRQGTPQEEKTRDSLRAPRPPPSPGTTARRRPRTAPRPPDMEEQGRRSPACPPSWLRSLSTPESSSRQWPQNKL